eukprot:CAMPEP_0171629352 /NCGR_PEP_ID=MMETSP0990-20121206/22117_1 /TAXON_ID=483369 /ORGANISM="non described non described, Strain CCMP2098" /LENGTH=71 /DNA_ID=CAMNT_0012197983 /DNA_START=84 /DNA_END=295 /DNA_ORIENTATION=-
MAPGDAPAMVSYIAPMSRNLSATFWLVAMPMAACGSACEIPPHTNLAPLCAGHAALLPKGPKPDNSCAMRV